MERGEVSVTNKKSISREIKRFFRIKDLFARDLALINAIVTGMESEKRCKVVSLKFTGLP